MPTLAPPPYQSRAGSLQWHAWYRQINQLLEGVTVSINAIDDVTISGVTDKEILVWDSGSAQWINQTIAEWDGELGALAGLTSAADRLPYFTGSGTASLATFTAAGRALLDDADAAAQIATLGLDADIATFALPASTTISTFGATLTDDADAATARATLGFDANVGAGTTVVTTTTHTHAAAERYLLCDTTSNAITVNLLAAATAGDGYRLDVKVTNASSTVTIDGSTTETIDGATTLVMSTLYDNASLVCDGSNWHLLGPVA